MLCTETISDSMGTHSLGGKKNKKSRKEGNLRKTNKGHNKVDFSYKCRNVILVQTR